MSDDIVLLAPAQGLGQLKPKIFVHCVGCNLQIEAGQDQTLNLQA